MTQTVVHQNQSGFLTLQFEGLSAFTDAYAIEGERLMFVSLFGSRVSVRAIWSALLSGSVVSLGECSVALDTRHKWHVLQRLTPSGILHAACFPESLEIGKAKDEFLVLGTSETDIESRFHLYLDRVSETPITKDWGRSIFKRALEDKKAEWLQGLNLFAVTYRHDESWLEDLVVGLVQKNTSSLNQKGTGEL